MDLGTVIEKSRVDDKCLHQENTVCQEKSPTENIVEDICLLFPEVSEEAAGPAPKSDVQNVITDNLYNELVVLHDENLVPYPFSFTCPVCLLKCEQCEGIILKECLHTFCKECLRKTIKQSEEIDIKCPYQGKDYTCESLLLENEIQKLLTEEEYADRLHLTLQHAEGHAFLGKRKHTESSDGSLYQALAVLQEENLVRYPFGFECPVCLESYGPLLGITLKECLHIFCMDCLTKSIQLSDNVDIKCPYQDENYSCPSLLLEHEIQALLTPEEYDERLRRTLQHAEVNTGAAAFHCKRPDCSGWCVNEEGLSVFECPVCGTASCVPCGAVHTGISCGQYAEAKSLGSGSVDVLKSQRVLNEMVRLGTAMYCPQCTAVVAKEMGCDGLTCTVCRTELCWATKGRRWGPAGRGDHTGGCRCNINGRKCHYSCNNCH